MAANTELIRVDTVPAAVWEALLKLAENADDLLALLESGPTSEE